MKKSLIFLLFILIILPFVSSLETTLKNEYKPGETAIFSISGLIDNIKKEDIQFYSGRSFVSLVYDVAKINDNFYIYATLPNIERNYTLLLKNAKFFDIEEKIQDIAYNFSAKGNISSFSVAPGFIITDKDFKIKINAIKKINLKSSFLGKTENLTIIYGEKQLSFLTGSIKKTTLTSLILEADNVKYELPVYILIQSNLTPNQITNPLAFSQSSQNIFFVEDTDFFFELILYNHGLDDINDIVLLPSSKKIKIPAKVSIPAGQNKKINFTINTDENISVVINATKGNLTAETTINLIALKNLDEYRNLTKNQATTNKTFLGNNATATSCLICKEDEKCSGSLKLVEGDICCIGTCKSSKSNNTLWIIIIIVALLVIAFFIYKKMKLKKETGNQMIKKKSEDYEERFKPKEIRGGLTRV